MQLSVVIPVYNERDTLGSILALVARVLPTVEKEIIVVDDCSADGTREWLKANFADGERTAGGIEVDAEGNLAFAPPGGAGGVTVRPIFHAHNQGKGGALRTGFAAVTGDVVVVQDADLEYDPHDWDRMYDLVAVRRIADVVYGSRFYGRPHRSLSFHHYMGNRLISFLFSFLFNQKLSDVQTCYKMMTRQAVDSIALTHRGFGTEIEIAARIVRQRKYRIYEVGITYYGRTHAEGKKINWKDGVMAIWYIVWFRLRAR
jgi:glycosyltransferase involved in cell wall biosynthesis